MILRALLAFGYALGWVPLFVFRVEAIRESLPSYGRGERLAVLLTPVIVGLHVTLACLLLSLGPLPTPERLAAGVVLDAAGLGFWLWARPLIGPLRLRRLPSEPPLRFQRGGAFGVVRHPLYFSFVVVSCAPVVALGSPYLAATFAAAFAAIAVRATQEERRLRAQLGMEYEEYRRRVKRLIPFVW